MKLSAKDVQRLEFIAGLRLPVTFRNRHTGARLIIDTRPGVERIAWLTSWVPVPQ